MNVLSPRAHVYNTLKTCEALQQGGYYQVTLVSTNAGFHGSNVPAEVLAKQSIITPFTIIGLDATTASSQSTKVSKGEMVVSNLKLIRFLFQHSKEYQLVYCRDPYLYPAAWVAKRLLGKPLFFEIHAVLHKKWSQRLLEALARLATGSIVISKGLESYYQKISARLTTIYCSAAEPERFEAISDNSEVLRQELGLPLDKKICGYTGNVSRTGNNDSYGLEDIIACLPLLPANYIFVAVGKRADDSKELEALADELRVSDRVIFIPWTTKDIVTKYIKAFDILIIPSAGAQIGNSPTKIFEYLVSGLPIVAADTQAIAEILKNKHNCLLVDYKKPRAWSEAILRLSQDTALSQQLIKQARTDGAEYTWAKRAEALATFIDLQLSPS